MPRTPVPIAAIALLVYGSSAFSQAAAPPTDQPAQHAAATTDEALTKAVYSALNADRYHYFRHVTVNVDNGVARLGGFVFSSDSLYRARTIAGRVPGVNHVDTSHLMLEPNRPR